MRKAPPVTKTQYRVSGTVNGCQIVPILFDSAQEAKWKVDELSHICDTSVVSEEVETIVEE